MKKKVLVACMLSFGLFLNGCRGETTKNEYGFDVAKIGPYIEISHQEGLTPSGDNITFYSVYDEQTKIMYRITSSDTNGYDEKLTIIYDFDYDEQGHPVLKFYDGGK